MSNLRLFHCWGHTCSKGTFKIIVHKKELYVEIELLRQTLYPPALILMPCILVVISYCYCWLVLMLDIKYYLSKTFPCHQSLNRSIPQVVIGIHCDYNVVTDIVQNFDGSL
jgi:hypothetical protein